MISTNGRNPLVFLTILLFLNILLLSIQVRNIEGRLLIRSWSLLLFSPIASSIYFLNRGAADVVSRYALLYNAGEENQRLRAENANLKVKVEQLEGFTAFLSRRTDHQLLQQQFSFNVLTTPVIWKSAPFHSHRLLIGIGGPQKARRDGAVVAPDGLVGRIWTTTPYTAEVELITNAGAAAGGVLEDSRLQGVIQGDGSQFLKWNFIPNHESVNVGDVVYSSGTDLIYPKGVPIGQVVKSVQGPIIYRDIWVKPFVDFLRLEEVMIVASK